MIIDDLPESTSIDDRRAEVPGSTTRPMTLKEMAELALKRGPDPEMVQYPDSQIAIDAGILDIHG